MIDNSTNIKEVCLSKINELDEELNSLRSDESNLENELTQLLIQTKYMNYSHAASTITAIFLVLKNQNLKGNRKDFFPELNCSDFMFNESTKTVEELMNTKYENIEQTKINIYYMKKDIDLLKKTNSNELIAEIQKLKEKMQKIQNITNFDPSQMHNLGKIKTFFQQNRDKIEEVENILKS